MILAEIFASKWRDLLKLNMWVGKDEFENRILKSTGPVLSVFSAKWCGFCTRFIEVLRNYESNYGSPAEIVDTDSVDRSLWDTYKIDFVPTLILFAAGKEVFRINGRPMAGLSIKDLQRAIDAASSIQRLARGLRKNSASSNRSASLLARFLSSSSQ